MRLEYTDKMLHHCIIIYKLNIFNVLVKHSRLEKQDRGIKRKVKV